MIRKQQIIIALSILLSGILQTLEAQDLQPGGNTVLDAYIQEALQSNQGLKQAQLDYAVNLSALKEAKGLFLPDVSINARYTVADGGRVITFPIGDLLNPVYSTLNQLTMSDQFPQVDNEEFPFYRTKEHETKVRMVQPILQSDLIHNYRIRKQGSEIARIGIKRYQQELIREVSKAYYSYQKAFQLVSLVDSTLDLVEENLRVSKSLYNNDKVTVDVVYRSEAEISKVELEKARAKNMLEASRSWFNFLLNRDLLSEITLTQQSEEPLTITLQEAQDQAIANRDELKQLAAYRELNKRQTALYRGANIPGIYGVVDYGFQGEEYKFTADDDYLMASVVLQWQLFNGTVNHQKVQQSKIEGEKLQSLLEQTEMQVSLEVVNHYFALQAALETIQAARSQERSARRVYTLIQRKYQEGQASLLELIDARTNMTNTAANIIIARSDYFSSLADFNHAIGFFSNENN